MNDDTKNKLKEGLKKLPDEVRKTVDSFEWEEITKEVGIKYSLDEKEIDILKNEIVFVLIEEKNMDSLMLNIENNIGTSKSEARQIAKDIDQLIFDKLREQIQNLSKNNLKTKNPDWEQTINFIISGGDYSVFLDK